jgi:hypothetical protein
LTLSKEQIASLRISRFIFHVVHHGEAEPIFFEELDIEDFEGFFLERIREALKGTEYEFNPQSQVCNILQEIVDDSSLFVDHSRQLAVNFHSHGLDDKRIKKGVMILMSLITLDKELFAIVKFEHDQVIRYSNNGSKVILESVADTFTTSPDALQKAAIVDMSEEEPQILVLDRNVRGGISGFFQGFLNVRRQKNEKELTETVWNVVKNTSNKHVDDFPPDFTQEVQQRTSDFIQKNEQFDDEEFFSTVFGPEANDSVRNTYKHFIEKEDLANEQFYLDRESASVAKKRKIKTAEGITIYIPDKAFSTVQISHGKDGEKDVIIIESAKVREEL